MPMSTHCRINEELSYGTSVLRNGERIRVDVGGRQFKVFHPFHAEERFSRGMHRLEEPVNQSSCLLEIEVRHEKS